MKPSKIAEKVFLPQTEKEFDELVNKLMKKFKLTNAHHTAAILANRIQHMPVDQATTTLEYLGHCVLKNVAYQVAQRKSQLITHELQCDQLKTELTANPSNQEARDALQKAATEGSKYAQQILENFFPEESKKVVSLVPEPSLEQTH